MTAVLKPSSTRPKAARRPAPPAPTTTASYWWSTTGYCREIASLLTLAESWPATVKLNPLAAAGSCWPLLRRPETRGIPAILAPLKPLVEVKACSLLSDGELAFYMSNNEVELCRQC